MVSSAPTPPPAAPAPTVDPNTALPTPTPAPKLGDPGSGGQPVVPQLPDSQNLSRRARLDLRLIRGRTRGVESLGVSNLVVLAPRRGILVKVVQAMALLINRAKG